MRPQPPPLQLSPQDLVKSKSTVNSQRSESKVKYFVLVTNRLHNPQLLKLLGTTPGHAYCIMDVI